MKLRELKFKNNKEKSRSVISHLPRHIPAAASPLDRPRRFSAPFLLIHGFGVLFCAWISEESVVVFILNPVNLLSHLSAPDWKWSNFFCWCWCVNCSFFLSFPFFFPVCTRCSSLRFWTEAIFLKFFCQCGNVNLKF